MSIYIEEIKYRIGFAFISYFSVLFTTYYYKEVFLFLVVVQLSVNNFNFKKSYTFYLIFTNVTEVFSAHIGLANFFSLQIFGACVIYHVLVFLIPALYKVEYGLISTCFVLIIGVWVTVVVALVQAFLPLLWSFFEELQRLIITKSFCIYFEIKLSEYLSFCYTIYYSVCLQAFIFVTLLAPLSRTIEVFLIRKRFRKLYYFCFLTFSTVVSPPDIFSQVLIYILLSVLYELLFVLSLFLGHPLKIK